MQEFEIQIPYVAENMQLPSPELLTFYRNLENRVLWLDDEVSSCFLEYARYIIQWNMDDKGVPVEDRKPIKLMFFSPGGSLDVNNALVDVILLSKTPVHGFNMGIAQSAACFIFMSCHKRYATPTSTFLVHKGSSSMSGTFNEVIAMTFEYQRQIEELVEFVKKHSDIDEDTLLENIDTEWYITAKDAYEKYHFVDQMVTSLDDLQ